MPLIMKSESGSSTQHQQFCVSSNQVSESSYSGQTTPQPQQAQPINISTADFNGSSSHQTNYTYQLLTSNQVQNSPNTVTDSKSNKQNKSFKCEQCNMMFTTKSAHTSHIKSHAKQVAQNSDSVNNSGNQQMQSSDPYQCDVCKKTFAVPARLVSSKAKKLKN